MNTPSEREKVAAKVKALLSKTQEKGCSEQEALSAALKAKELLEKYDLNLTEAELLSDGFQEDELKESNKKRAYARGCLDIAIAEFTDTEIWGARGKAEFKFFGLTSDVVFARFLHDSLSDFVMRNADAFAEKQIEVEGEKMGIPLSRAQRLFAPQSYRWWESFTVACTARISERLKEAKKGACVKSATGNELVALDKKALVSAELKKRGIKLRTIKLPMQKADVDGIAAGKEAGNKAGFDKPINGGDDVLQFPIRGKPSMLPNGRNSYK